MENYFISVTKVSRLGKRIKKIATLKTLFRGFVKAK